MSDEKAVVYLQGNLIFSTAWTDLEGIMLSETSQSKTKNTMWFHLNVEFHEYNKQNRNRLIENRLTAVRGEGGCGVGEKGEGIKQ